MFNEVMENDTQKAWKLINELKNESLPTDNLERINHQKWFDHFHDLLNTETSHIVQTRLNSVKNEFDQYLSHH